jgi:5-methyltetrahydropteroyltriglutamate--homocysteine methyltransferase
MEHASNLRRPSECTLQTTKGERDVSIRSTHVGSLIRPASLLAFEAAIERGESYDEAAYAETLKAEVADVVRRQAEAGIDIVSDGEFGKANWIAYLYNRISGVAPRELGPNDSFLPPSRDRQAFPGTYAQHDKEMMRAFAENEVPAPAPSIWVCNGPIEYDRTAVDNDIANLRAALEGVDAEGFLPVVAPASTYWLENQHYATEEEFVYALADALAVEYKAIVDSGFMLQVDDAVLMHEMDSILAEGGSMKDYRDWAQLRVDALNHALKDIPPEKVRYHVCWGSWHGPHAYDPPLAEVVDLVLQVNAHAYMMEQANPRHEHEWRVWEDVKLPEGKMLIPGVVTHHTVIVEHPDLVADRLVRLAELVGPDNVMAGTDCGFAQTAFMQRVHPEVQWAKLTALAEGARIASDRLGVTA